METNTLNEAVETEIAKELLFEDENRLKIVAGVILITGILSAFILLFTIALVEVGGEILLNWAGLVSTITTLLFSIGVWAFLRVISNISITLKDMGKTGKLD